MKRVIVLSGLPASGKTTLGRALAKHLGFLFIDKDDILDDLFRQKALEVGDCVLTSFWRPLGSRSTSGTSSDWISATSNDFIEDRRLDEILAWNDFGFVFHLYGLDCLGIWLHQRF